MASTTPVLKQVSWLSLVPQLAIAVLLVLAAGRLGAGDPYLAAAIVYLAMLFSLRWIVAFHHRMGMRHVRNGEFERAIQRFEKSYEFFRRHPWIDKFRYVTLLSSARPSYREMALLNIAFSHGQIGNGRQAQEYYRKTLAEFPDSGMAKSSLRMMAAAQNAS
jgi:tetratricopeptide (TPR) repeat protein